MADNDSLPTGWSPWSDEAGGRLILTYRPDVFDGDAFDGGRLPTIVVAPGRSPDRPAGERANSNAWHLTLYLEPTVRVREIESTFDDRSDAVAGAVRLAHQFVEGQIDVRGAYRDPPATYLDRLEALIESS